MASNNPSYNSLDDEEGEDPEYEAEEPDDGDDDEYEAEEPDDGDDDEYDIHVDPDVEAANAVDEADDLQIWVSAVDEDSEVEVLGGAANADDEPRDRSEGCGESSGGGLELDRSLSPNCPVCFEPWTSEGPHRVSCIPCGHVYGRSCLERWVQRCGNSTGKCPQCNKKFKKKDIINLYAPLIGVKNDDLEKELHSLRKKNDLLNLEKNQLIEKIIKQKDQIHGECPGRQKRACLEQASSRVTQRQLFEQSKERSSSSVQHFLDHNFSSQNSRVGFRSCSFVLQRELMVDGARVFGIDAYNQILAIAGKAPQMGSEHVLSKIRMLGSYETDRIELPPNTGAVRDLCILPGSLVLLASLGKKLSLFSMESNHLVLRYDLPAPAWSCSLDYNNPYHIYAGLQNGMLMVFDLRQTAQEVESIAGLSSHPIHTIHSLVQNNSTRKVLTASSLGPCVWDVDGGEERPSVVPGMENEGVCISLACSNSTDDMVASFRPKVELSTEAISSQTSASPTPPVSGTGKLGSHVLIRRVNDTFFQRCEVGYGHVSEVRMSKSAIISMERSSPLFAYGDESTHRVTLLHLPSFNAYTHLKPHQYPILDLKYACSTGPGPGLLGCVSEDRLQLFTCHDP